MSAITRCRGCSGDRLHPVLDLGLQPLANSLHRTPQEAREEERHPLTLLVCQDCWLMQLGQLVPPAKLFSEYVYFSSFSQRMLDHAAQASARYIGEMQLGSDDFVLEIASNDGYMLRNFTAKGVPCLGVEPAENVARVAREAGVPTLGLFFTEETAVMIAQSRGKADLILANNVFAHVPDPHDFLEGISRLLAPDGMAVFEFPYGVDMVKRVEFDTIYHEHCFYFTLTALRPLLRSHGLEIFNVERLDIHGGSLRIFISHAGARLVQAAVDDLIREEIDAGVGSPDYYSGFSLSVRQVCDALQKFMSESQKAGKSVAAYGASAKGSTLLNCLGESARHVEFIVDRSTHKHGKLSPGLHLPILNTDELLLRRPNFTILLAWNFAEEILRQQAEYLRQGGAFVLPLPEIKVLKEHK